MQAFPATNDQWWWVVLRSTYLCLCPLPSTPVRQYLLLSLAAVKLRHILYIGRPHQALIARSNRARSVVDLCLSDSQLGWIVHRSPDSDPVVAASQPTCNLKSTFLVAPKSPNLKHCWTSDNQQSIPAQSVNSSFLIPSHSHQQQTLFP